MEFSIPETEDNGASILRIEYPIGDGVSDLDLFVFRRMGDGSWEQIGSSTSDNSADQPCTLGGRAGDCSFEAALIQDLGNGDFKFRVGNWASTSTDWVGRLTTSAPAEWPGRSVTAAGAPQSYAVFGPIPNTGIFGAAISCLRMQRSCCAT